jgi:ribonuclease HII
VGIVDSQTIDRINILQATFAAMKIALDKIGHYDFALIDGNQKPFSCEKLITVVGGDSKSLSVAAASIVAKHTRDMLMLDYHNQHPEFLFAKHFGYGTKVHFAAINTHGPLELHRKTFLKQKPFI